MKKVTVFTTTLIAAVLTSGLAMAKPGHHHDPKAHFERLDANGDGKITAQEFEKDKAERFSRADANGDGYVSKDEWQGERSKTRAERLARHFEQADQNGDGKISKAEAAKMRPERFERLDANGDGFISKGEVERAPSKRPPKGGHHFDRLDANGDGKISRSELVDRDGAFRRLDTNGDGALTLSELANGRPSKGVAPGKKRGHEKGRKGGKQR